MKKIIFTSENIFLAAQKLLPEKDVE